MLVAVVTLIEESVTRPWRSATANGGVDEDADADGRDGLT